MRTVSFLFPPIVGELNIVVAFELDTSSVESTYSTKVLSFVACWYEIFLVSWYFDRIARSWLAVRSNIFPQSIRFDGPEACAELRSVSNGLVKPSSDRQSTSSFCSFKRVLSNECCVRDITRLMNPGFGPVFCIACRKTFIASAFEYPTNESPLISRRQSSGMRRPSWNKNNSV